MTKKTLYFEGAGWSNADISKATIGNCRIRTAFKLNNGKCVYLEITACEQGKYSSPLCKWKYTGFVDHCFYITDEKPNDDENKHQISLTDNERIFEYSESGILRFVNYLGANFDNIKVVPDLGGYRVFGDNNTFNYGDIFQYDPVITGRREEVYQYFYQLERNEGKEYPNFSLWVDADSIYLLHLLRHFNGYNKHYLIDISTNWKETIKETPLGRYGC